MLLPITYEYIYIFHQTRLTIQKSIIGNISLISAPISHCKAKNNWTGCGMVDYNFPQYLILAQKIFTQKKLDSVLSNMCCPKFEAQKIHAQKIKLSQNPTILIILQGNASMYRINKKTIKVEYQLTNLSF